MEPAIGAMSGLIFLGEELSSRQWAGIGLVMLASIGCTLIARDPKHAAELL
jgi:inner membrane transporter RhtA